MMKTPIVLCAAGLVTAAVLMSAAPADASGLERLKALAGEWEGKGTDGQDTRVTYEVTSNGTAVVETMSAGETHSMVTVYHRDGDRLMMTHYCALGNQPRMRSEKSAQDGALRFAMIDATNLPDPQAGHMHKLAMRFPDPGHLVHEWTFTEKGQERVEVFNLARKK